MNNKKKYFSNSLRTQFANLYNSNKKDNLSNLLYLSTEDWYEQKHGPQSYDEIRLIDNLEVNKCPYCRDENIIKFGYNSHHIQIFKCKSCNRKFNPLTGTIFANHKIAISEWNEFIIHLTQYHSIKSSAIDNRNDTRTGRYWLKKIFIALKSYNSDVKLEDTIYIDEKYFPLTPSQTMIKESGKKYRGLSRNKLCVFTALDSKHLILVVNGIGKPSMKRIWESLGNHIKENSTIIDDEEKTHNYLTDRLNLTRISYNAKQLHGLKDKENPLNPINTVYRYLNAFIRSHGAYDRKELQDWLNLFMFIYERKGNPAKVSHDLLKLLFETKIVYKYRDLYPKKS